jgi:hypothetical protein
MPRRTRQLLSIAILVAAVPCPAFAAGRWFSGPRSAMSLGTPQRQAPYQPGASPYVTAQILRAADESPHAHLEDVRHAAGGHPGRLAAVCSPWVRWLSLPGGRQSGVSLIATVGSRCNVLAPKPARVRHEFARWRRSVSWPFVPRPRHSAILTPTASPPSCGKGASLVL